MESPPQNLNNEIENEICPYCNMILTKDIFEDHIICHTIDILENHSQKYNVNDYLENGQNSNTQNEKNVFDKFIDFFRNPTKQEENKNLNEENNNSNNNTNNNSINEENNNISQRTSNNTNENSSGINPTLDIFRSLFLKRPTRRKTKIKPNKILFRIFNKIINNNTNDQNQRNNRNNINVRELSEALRQDMELREDPFYQEHPELIKKEKDIDAILNDLPVSIITEKKPENSDNCNCVICLTDFEYGDEVISLPCFHIFHKDCITYWLENKLWCPVCKFKISLSSLHREI